MVTKIYVKNNVFQHIQVLKTNRKKRHFYGEFVVEGVRNINEAIRCGWKIKAFLFGEKELSDWAKKVTRTVKTDRNFQFSDELMKELSGKDETSELMAVVSIKEISVDEIEVSKNPFIVLFDRPSNRGNLGTMIRSCDAFGVDFLVITGHAVDLYDPDVITSSMGSFFSLSVIKIEGYELLDKLLSRIRNVHKSFRLIGTTSHQKKPIYDTDLSTPLMLLIGNETRGLSYAYREKCDELCSIPMVENAAATSFNVSCAASVLMYEVARQRGKKE